MNIQELSAAFPPDAVHWRAQAVSQKNPDAPKAMALAYIDARDVMARLDMVCGPDGWQDSYVETASGRVLCTLTLRIGDEWISKSDGAGSTDIEGDKGGLSDAFKRAAVKWGIGRYLYDMPCPWVPCELYNGKWSKWTAAGIQELRRVAAGGSPAPASKPAPKAVLKSDPEMPESERLLYETMRAATSLQSLMAWLKTNRPLIDELDQPKRDKLREEFAAIESGFKTVETMAA